jgi:hypothetical protein
MPNAAFVVMLTVDSINMESLTITAGDIQDSLEQRGLEVVYVNPYARAGSPPPQPFAPPTNPSMDQTAPDGLWT